MLFLAIINYFILGYLQLLQITFDYFKLFHFRYVKLLLVNFGY
jgi:hypothetical protein